MQNRKNEILKASLLSKSYLLFRRNNLCVFAPLRLCVAKYFFLRSKKDLLKGHRDAKPKKRNFKSKPSFQILLIISKK